MTEELFQDNQTCIIVYSILTDYHPCFGYVYSSILAFAVGILICSVVFFYGFACALLVKLLIYWHSETSNPDRMNTDLMWEKCYLQELVEIPKETQGLFYCNV